VCEKRECGFLLELLSTMTSAYGIEQYLTGAAVEGKALLSFRRAGKKWQRSFTPMSAFREPRPSSIAGLFIYRKCGFSVGRLGDLGRAAFTGYLLPGGA
jgi:hypothetical protein